MGKIELVQRSVNINKVTGFEPPTRIWAFTLFIGLFRWHDSALDEKER